MLNRRVVAMLGAVCVLAFALLLSFLFSGGDVSEPSEPVVVATPSPSPTPDIVTPAIPAELEGFHDWPERQRVEAVTKYFDNTALPDDIEAFFLEQVRNKGLSRLVRNNMAESLVVQSDPIPGLADIFLSIIQDPSEKKDYRLYSIQHFAMSLSTASDPEAAREELRSLATDSDDEDISTRAALMVNYGEGRDLIAMPELDGLIGERLRDETLSDSTRISLMALVGSRGLTEHLDLVRAEARKDSPVRRAAIAALGSIGDEADIAFLREQAGSRNTGIALAAKGALKRLEQKTTPTAN